MFRLITRHNVTSKRSHKLLDVQTAQLSTQSDFTIHRLSRLWSPSGGISISAAEDGHSKLIRAGFLRQAHSGVFHLLPLGRKVQEKIESLIDKHMRNLGASRLDLSNISSQSLWSRSGRLAKIDSELFLFEDRKQAKYLLSPTHEEEITSLVASTTKSYKELPIRLYQITRKFRDELRPRHGLLRSREFVMKDLYTFDTDIDAALETYHDVRKAYNALFDELNVPYMVAEADSGDMGGNLSHEYHFPTPVGEDNVITCQKCDYVANEELARSYRTTNSTIMADCWLYIESDKATTTREGVRTFSVWRGVTRDRSTLVNVWYALGKPDQLSEINTHAVKNVVSDLDPGVMQAVMLWSSNRSSSSTASSELIGKNVINLIDSTLPWKSTSDIVTNGFGHLIQPADVNPHTDVLTTTLACHPNNGTPLDLLRIREGDNCPSCETGTLKVQRAIELGHTFFLGARYSEPLDAKISIPQSHSSRNQGKENHAARSSSQECAERLVPMQMGCHGIGVSRMLGAIAETMSDDRGLNWPRLIAPFEVVVVASKGNEAGATEVYRQVSLPSQNIQLDVILDDRSQSLAWKLNDADLVGYPIIVVVGKYWASDHSCEVQCRRLDIKEVVQVGHLRAYIEALLDKL